MIAYDDFTLASLH